jgi:hypothetical protein
MSDRDNVQQPGVPVKVVTASRSGQGFLGTTLHSLLGTLAAGIITLAICVGFDKSLATDIINNIENTIGTQGDQSSNVLEALYLQKECSNELPECWKPGAVADRTNQRCFSICIAADTGCRSCCSESMCYWPPVVEKTLGFCRPCPDGGDGNQCALTIVTRDTHIGFVLLTSFLHDSKLLRKS